MKILMRDIKAEQKFRVDMNVVSKSDSSPSYLKLVQSVIRKGRGYVEVKETKGDRVVVFSALTEPNIHSLVWIPKDALK